MARTSSRERQERFIKSFDGVQGLDFDYALERILRRRGLSWLTDEQMVEVVSEMAGRARFSQQMRVRNRAALRRAS